MAGWSDWVNLAYDDEEMADQASPAMPSAPEYPYGLRICLCGPELEKLGLPLPSKGDLLHVMMMAEVTSVSDGVGGQRVELQVKMMKLEDEDTESTSEDDDE